MNFQFSTDKHEDKAVSQKDIYESLWRCRDFEISHLWQRSVFLTAFLVLFITGYGTLVPKLLDKGEFNENMFYMCTFVLCLISVFSMLWIMMAKGSKAWYEKYELAIYEIERNSKYIDPEVKDMDDDKVMHGSLPPTAHSECLLSTSGGSFSPSRINILIGHVFLCGSWLALALQVLCTYQVMNTWHLVIAVMLFLLANAISLHILKEASRSRY